MSTFGPYPARVVEVHDGDTCRLDIDLGFGVQMAGVSLLGRPMWSCRVYGINAPELRVKDIATGVWMDNPAGLEARDFARGLLPIGSIVTVVSHGWDSYSGRYDGTITLPDGRDFAAVMLVAGQAVDMKGYR